ncbi:MAG: amidohydrolase [Planctomycetota bacterium]
MRLLTRRRVLAALGIGGAGLAAARIAVPRALRPGPVRPIAALSPAARALVGTAFAGVDPARVWDLHAHAVGIGTGGSGCRVSRRFTSHLHPIRRCQYEAYLAASGIRDPSTADEDYLARLLALHRAANPAGRRVLLAFDLRVAEDGTELPEDSEFHVPTEYVAAIARQHPDVALAASVHPYRRDCRARLEAARAAGAIAVKWLPNSMGIDPASPLCDAAYDAMAELGLVLLSHAGHERAVHAAGDQELGNPLRLRRALERGVRVVIAHCASLGEARDLDAGGTARRPCFDLFLRLMGEKAHAGRLFGDISALPLVNRCGRPLRELLLASDLHPRLADGSDYPLPAIGPLVSTWLLARRGLLDPSDRDSLEEIFAANSLLFDYVLKRRLRVVTAEGERRFAPIVFETARLFG